MRRAGLGSDAIDVKPLTAPNASRYVADDLWVIDIAMHAKAHTHRTEDIAGLTAAYRAATGADNPLPGRAAITISQRDHHALHLLEADITGRSEAP